MTLAAPTSPCINVCVLDAAGTCSGCGRTLDEIARWGRMSAAEQWAVIARLDRLRQQAANSPVATAERRSGTAS
jgi:predicted Fe-S protein YdhL (DUF1289 family)